MKDRHARYLFLLSAAFLAHFSGVLTGANSGKILEVSADGDLVWEFQNIYDDKRNGVVSMATVLPEDFFLPEALSSLTRTEGDR